MGKQTATTPDVRTVRTPPFRFGFWIGLLTALFTAISFGIAVTTLPVSGPFCQVNCVTYPYHDVVALVPHDYVWMVPAIVLVAFFLMLMVCIHHNAPENRRLYSQIGLAFAVISAAVLSIDYYIQLAMVQPSLLKGEFEGLALISQYNPHGIFIALEELGYLAMSLTFLFMGMVYVQASRLERAIRWLLTLSALIAFVVYVAMSLIYGKDLEYRFEVAIITINWTTLLVAGLLLSILFRRPRT